MKSLKPTLLLTVILLAATLPAPAGDIQIEWAYHSAGNTARMTERVPGETMFFLANGVETVSSSATVTLYVLTDKDFAGDMDEQIFARWWDGSRANWIMGAWVKNIELNADTLPFRGHPETGTRVLDLWRIDIPPQITRPGDNFYAIQLKGFQDDQTIERYLLKSPGGDFSRTNQLGQIWSASEEFDGQDWRIRVTP